MAPNEIDDLNSATKASYAERRQCFLDLYDYAEGLTKSPDKQVADVAFMAFKVLDLYGRGFVYQKLANQAICYYRIIEQLQKLQLPESAVTASFTEAIARLDALQKTYEKQYMALGNALTGNTVPSKLRQELNTSVKLLFETIRAQAISSKDEAMIDLFNNMMTRLVEINTARTRRRADDEGVEGEDETSLG